MLAVVGRYAFIFVLCNDLFGLCCVRKSYLLFAMFAGQIGVIIELECRTGPLIISSDISGLYFPFEKTSSKAIYVQCMTGGVGLHSIIELPNLGFDIG